ncbi:histidine phosphatase family protein [Paenibacillus gansuensis]|uniref:Histidine phosphatase family protein n=1 Tax=Paenibacillus gansuensis TaxID=306542 RepID=A0ABW5PBK4_9BACL
MATVYLVRHCKASGQEPEAHLTEEGQHQAERLADLFADKKVDRIVSSPFLRAVASVRPLADRIGVTVETDVRLEERVLSTEHLSNWMELLAQTYFDMNIKFAGGESSLEAGSRGMAVLRELSQGRHRNIVVCTHGNLLSLMLKHYHPAFGFEEWKKLTNPDVFESVLTDGEIISLHRIWS